MSAQTQTAPVQGADTEPRLNMIEALHEALDTMLTRDDDVIEMGEDVGYCGGVFRCTAGLQEKHGQTRVFDTPINECGIIGVAVGMGAYGLLVFAIFHAWRMRRVAEDAKDAKMASALVIALSVQAVIGIITLLTQIEMEWALLHQFWAFVILVVAVLHRARLTGHGYAPASQPA